MVWLYEITGTMTTFFTFQLHDLGFPSVYYLDAIFMFVIIPFVHLMNDEETKGIIAERSWYEGVRHMLGENNQKSL